MSKFKEVIEFWRSEREAEYTPEEERWKCRYCQFAKSCPGNPSLQSPESCYELTTERASSFRKLTCVSSSANMCLFSG